MVDDGYDILLICVDERSWRRVCTHEGEENRDSMFPVCPVEKSDCDEEPERVMGESLLNEAERWRG